MNAATWTQTHEHTAHGSGKYRHLGNLTVVQGSLLEGGTGWVFLYRGLFTTETHRGFPTMAAAKAAAVAYSTSPVSEAHAAADAYRA